MDEASVEAEIANLKANLLQVQRDVSDHAQRFETLQTPFWKRLLFWLDGWPWHDLNASARHWRPWHGH